MTRLPYETIAGQASEGETFAQLIEYLTLAEEASNIIGHLRKANDDQFLGQGFLAIGEMLHKTRMNVIKLSMSKSGSLQ
jgi:hypothetical protein